MIGDLSISNVGVSILVEEKILSLGGNYEKF